MTGSEVIIEKVLVGVVALRDKQTGRVHWFPNDAYLRVFPDRWEAASVAVENGLVESEAEKAVVETPLEGEIVKEGDYA